MVARYSISSFAPRCSAMFWVRRRRSFQDENYLTSPPGGRSPARNRARATGNVREADFSLGIFWCEFRGLPSPVPKCEGPGAPSLWFRKGTRDQGHPPSRQLCPCQKHPLTWIAVRYFGRTISRRPGRSRTCSRNLNPSLNSTFLTSISGFVSFDRMRDIFAER